MRVFQRHECFGLGNNEAIAGESDITQDSFDFFLFGDFPAGQCENSSLAKAGRNRGTTILDVADSLVDETSIVKLLKDIHNLSSAPPLYGVYRNPDFGRR
ncbi:hypothetical protein QM042_02025 [Escherichia coli]